MIGPDIPVHLLGNCSTTPEDNDNEEAGPSTSIGPVIPSDVLSRPREATPPVNAAAPDEDEDDDDDYAPALPPDLVAARSGPPAQPPPVTTSRHMQGPALPPRMHPQRYDYSDEDDDDVGPMPLPHGVVIEEEDGVSAFLKKEEQRRKHIEVRPSLARTPAASDSMMPEFSRKPRNPKH